MAKQDEREWTLMFYFASDNPLAPGIVSQLKAIKQAGFHHEVNVIAQFDPQPPGTPTHVFDVNNVRKLRIPENRIGFVGFNERDPFVTNLVEDKLWRETVGEQQAHQVDRADTPIMRRLRESLAKRSIQVDRAGTPIRQRLRESLAERSIVYDPPEPPPDRTLVTPPAGAASEVKKGDDGEPNNGTRELTPKESLEAFLTFCRESYRARHYMLFILGHGVVVGNDIFLFDENPRGEQSLSLKDLGELLSDFKKGIDEGSEFELVSFHSCSVSSLEVVYELQQDSWTAGTANYMLASQGPAFVGSWPYRQILMSIFNNVFALRKLERQRKTEEARENVRELVRDIFSYCYYNSTDFLVAGYSFDLSLCDLNQVAGLTKSLAELSRALNAGLTDDDQLFKDLTVLAHWEAQSQWQENYTDLGDFCFCLSRQGERFLQRLGKHDKKVLGPRLKKLRDIINACGVVRSQLTKEISGGEKKLIVKSEFAGPGHQYSNGLSVFFPWSRPVSDPGTILQDYEKYKFNQALRAIEKSSSWFDFLDNYFNASRRRPRKSEAMEQGVEARPQRTDQQVAEDELAEDLLSLVFNDEGRLSQENSPADVLKIGTRDPTGDECTCSSIKNYPRDTREQREKRRQAGPTEDAVPVSQPSVTLSQKSFRDVTTEFTILP